MSIYHWLVRRELWENRAVWVIPAILAAAMTIAALFGRVEVVDTMPGSTAGGVLLLAIGTTFFGVMIVYSTWYLLDCLYADRKDKSILFWKSLPISDAQMVLAKLATALLIIPLVYFAAADVAALLAAFILSVRAHSTLGGAMWSASLWLQLQALWVYLIITSALWYLPLAGYLLVVSAWARRAVMLWSVLPPLAIVLIERWFFGTNFVLHQIWVRLSGHAAAAFRVDPALWSSAAHDPLRTLPSIWSLIDVGGFIANAQTLLGIAVGVVLVFCAIQLRAHHAES